MSAARAHGSRQARYKPLGRGGFKQLGDRGTSIAALPDCRWCRDTGRPDPATPSRCQPNPLASSPSADPSSVSSIRPCRPDRPPGREPGLSPVSLKNRGRWIAKPIPTSLEAVSFDNEGPAVPFTAAPPQPGRLFADSFCAIRVIATLDQRAFTHTLDSDLPKISNFRLTTSTEAPRGAFPSASGRARNERALERGGRCSERNGRVQDCRGASSSVVPASGIGSIALGPRGSLGTLTR